MRPSLWADRLMALSVRFVGLGILAAALAAAVASFFYNKAQEDEQATRVAMQVNVRLRDQLAVLEGVRALYQSDTCHFETCFGCKQDFDCARDRFVADAL